MDCGTIVSCELPLHDDGRSSGTALIEFDSPYASAAAVSILITFRFDVMLTNTAIELVVMQRK